MNSRGNPTRGIKYVPVNLGCTLKEVFTPKQHIEISNWALMALGYRMKRVRQKYSLHYHKGTMEVHLLLEIHENCCCSGEALLHCPLSVHVTLRSL